MAAKCKISDDKTIEIGKLLNDSQRPLKERFRALFTLRGIDNELAIEEIARCFGDESALLKHELAYCLGQMQNPKAIPPLIAVLEDVAQEPMVRHEAGKWNFLLPVTDLPLPLVQLHQRLFNKF